MNRTIILEHDYPQPVEAVWQALTDPKAIASWLMPNDFLPQVGHRFQFHTRPIPRFGFDGIVNCEVLEIITPTRLAYSWQGGSLKATIVQWILTPTANGTHLRLEHSGFEGLNNLSVSILLGRGWKNMLRRKLAAQIQALASAQPFSNTPAECEPSLLA